ncbi:26S proteasome non-ATPase regulatory subunit 9 isoform X2 [Sphaerodactylus townsendi]|uniref:26S proteasome non-ATPase regulatory subunit 9 isoform X2 n=1 Tax=Sphaerodactylus townsendi TaxID=933632 RepID=UPI00202612E0|nr:26S proteasome non-ATPase regulatory subunit 9 isoform X2 [Sphaerodactylus townsendi]
MCRGQKSHQNCPCRVISGEHLLWGSAGTGALKATDAFLPAGLQNDHKALMREVEQALHQLHASEKEKRKSNGAEAHAEARSQSQSEAPLLPFARVNAVTPGSPASMSGLQVDDEIVEFGSVNARNFQSLQNIATVVQHSEGKPLSMTVLRSGERMYLGLTPKRWNGKGLLGCNIVPLQR